MLCRIIIYHHNTTATSILRHLFLHFCCSSFIKGYNSTNRREQLTTDQSTDSHYRVAGVKAMVKQLRAQRWSIY